MGALLRLIPPVAWIGAGGLIIAALSGAGAWLYHRGSVNHAIKVEKFEMEQLERQRQINATLNAQQSIDDANTAIEIKENEHEWGRSQQ